MDAHRFDGLTRAFAAKATRRSVLKRALAATSGGAIATLGLDDAEAKPICIPTKGICNEDAECCSGFCNDGAGNAIWRGQRRCACPEGSTPCGKWGSCCAVGTPCIDGICQEFCPPEIDCEDGDLCTVNSCDPATGCVSTPVECPVCQVCEYGECVPDWFNQGGYCTVEGVEGICIDGECLADVCDDECPDCTTCFQGDCIPDQSQNGTQCVDIFGLPGFCDYGFCAADYCEDDACPDCQTCVPGGCAPDPSQDGETCWAPESDGVCENGVCVVPACPDECPVCQMCSEGACVPIPSSSGIPCTVDGVEGICMDGVCVTDPCPAGCSTCQVCDNGLCVVDPIQEGAACAGPYAGSICINGSCGCPQGQLPCDSQMICIDNPNCQGLAQYHLLACTCVCPDAIECPPGEIPYPEYGCQCFEFPPES
jgi:hypothetical protein